MTINLFMPLSGTESQIVPKAIRSKKAIRFGSSKLLETNQFSLRNFLFKLTKNIKLTPTAAR